jgi:arylsulfatase A-like enzyme
MSRLSLLKQFTAMLVFCALYAGLGLAATDSRPNFLFILVDDLGYADLGCYGSTFYDTPRLDEFAKSALRFTNGYAAHPVCSPTRAAIMTGQNPARVGITDWIPGSNPKGKKLKTPSDKHKLPLEHVTIAEALKQAEYRTFFAGKWHLGGEGSFPEDQGFDINIGGHHVGSPPGGYHAPFKNPKLKNRPDDNYLPDRLTDETLKFIEDNRGRPFLAYLSFYTVHTPIQPCKRHIEEYLAKRQTVYGDKKTGSVQEHDGKTRTTQDNPGFASMVRAMDENVGRLLDKLDELKLTGKTVVIFTSDNGGLTTLGRRPGPTCVRPLRGGKGWCYEGGIRVPLIVRAPGVTEPGSECDVPVYSADFYPTMLSLAGIELMPKQHSDGLDLTDLMKAGTPLDREFIVWHYPHYHGSAWRPGSAIRSGKWKLVEHYDYEKIELFDLEKDIGEKNDLSGKMPEKVKELHQMMRKYLESVDAEFPEPAK